MDSSPQDTAFDHCLKSKWARRMDEGSFRYRLDDDDTFIRDLSEGSASSRSHPSIKALFSPLRATKRRPPEAMHQVAQEFDKMSFHFGRIDDDREALFELHLFKEERIQDKSGRRDLLVINSSPFAPGHSLLLPEVDLEHPQVLRHERSISLAIKCVMLSGSPYLRAAFNSPCAFASVNHLHWHLFYTGSEASNFRLPVETLPAHSLGHGVYELTDYPAVGFCFQVLSPSDLSLVAKQILCATRTLVAQNVAHNVFITRGRPFGNTGQTMDDASSSYKAVRIIVWPRQKCSGAKEAGSHVIAVCELAGMVLMYDQKHFDTISYEEIAAELRDTCEETYFSIKDLVLSEIRKVVEMEQESLAEKNGCERDYEPISCEKAVSQVDPEMIELSD